MDLPELPRLVRNVWAWTDESIRDRAWMLSCSIEASVGVYESWTLGRFHSTNRHAENSNENVCAQAAKEAMNTTPWYICVLAVSMYLKLDCPVLITCELFLIQAAIPRYACMHDWYFPNSSLQFVLFWFMKSCLAYRSTNDWNLPVWSCQATLLQYIESYLSDRTTVTEIGHFQQSRLSCSGISNYIGWKRPTWSLQFVTIPRS